MTRAKTSGGGGAACPPAQPPPTGEPPSYGNAARRRRTVAAPDLSGCGDNDLVGSSDTGPRQPRHVEQPGTGVSGARRRASLDAVAHPTRTIRDIGRDDQGLSVSPGRRAGWPGPRVATPPGGGGLARAAPHTPRHATPSACRGARQPRATRPRPIRLAEAIAGLVIGAGLGAVLALALTAIYLGGWITPSDPSLDRIHTERFTP